MTYRFATAALGGLLLACLLALPAAAVELQGHRGARGLWPENTLPAFRGAAALGVDTLELDTVVSRDGMVVVSHEPRLTPDLARGPDGRWVDPPGPLVRDLDYAEIRRYDVGRAQPGSRTAKHFPQQQAIDGTWVPTLAEVLAISREHPYLRYNVEIKFDPEHPDETPAAEPFTKAVLQVIR
ncbi:MAG TPA: glycerophosphodiester phosphodiesterase family protein, partial [Alphaproteobacteria bacterium]|nr:glycerophosphodiester phosphodiesterase family protein [Alphaproteobacteria bacterium]